MVTIAAMFAANAERLTRRTPGDQIGAREYPPIDLSNVFVNDRPMFDMLNALSAIVKDRRNGVSIPFDHEVMAETGTRETQPKPTTTREQLDAPHYPPP